MATKAYDARSKLIKSKKEVGLSNASKNKLSFQNTFRNTELIGPSKQVLGLQKISKDIEEAHRDRYKRIKTLIYHFSSASNGLDERWFRLKTGA